jgi:hypothetical protein
MQTSRLSRRNRIILYIVSVLLVLSMVISAIVSFSPTAQTTQSQGVTPTTVVAP